MPPILVVAGVACATGTPPSARATVAAAAPSAPDRAADPTASPEDLTRAWVALVEAGDWQRMVSLIHPDYQALARAALPTLTVAKQSRLQETARKLGRALASGSPVFVPARATPTVSWTRRLPNDLPFSSERLDRDRSYHGREERPEPTFERTLGVRLPATAD